MNLPGTGDLRTLPHSTINSYCAILWHDNDWHANLVGEQAVNQAIVGVTYDFLEEAHTTWVFVEPSGLLHVCELLFMPIGVDETEPDVLMYQLQGENHVLPAT